MTQHEVAELVYKLDVMDGRIAGCGATVLNFQKINTARSKEFYCINNYSFNLKINYTTDYLKLFTYSTKDFISMALNTTKYCNTNICLDVPQPQSVIFRYRQQ